MPNILEKIVCHKRGEIEEAKRARPVQVLADQLAVAPPVRDFAGSLSTQASNDLAAGISLIAEVKKASPSAGLIREDFNPVAIAKTYQQHGAACISCLTDEHYFQGSLDHLQAIRVALDAPVLRKDFVLDRYQVLEARVAGADCVLLIAECIDDSTLCDLFEYAIELGMQALIEIYEPENLDRVLKLEPSLIGINNRNLKTFQTDLNHTISLSGRVPNSCVLVSESGIRDRQDVITLSQAGVHAILVGETLMRAPDIGAKVDELLGKG